MSRSAASSLVDTRDSGRSQSARPAALMLQGLDAPPLEQVTADHVVARAFYLMRGFQAARLQHASGRNRVRRRLLATGSPRSLLAMAIGRRRGSGDVALDGGARQRELSLRFGVNLVMVALTGNYKADQVHIPALLERLGR
ncbi:MAG: DUF4159 domain-containing protein [Terricaulis sp.]